VACEEWGKTQALIPKHMRSFEESQKSKKTVASMIERKGDDKENKKKGNSIFVLIIDNLISTSLYFGLFL
jgi:signal recognition particle receptor subunit alpha